MIDPYYFRLSEVGYPNDLKSISLPDHFKVYLLSSSSHKKDIFVHSDRREFAQSSKRDDKDVIRVFTRFIAHCEDCANIQEVFDSYDDDDFHPACVVKIGNINQQVYRLRKNDIRLYLVRLEHYVVFFRIYPKRQLKLRASDLHVIEERVKAIFKYPVNQDAFLKRLK